MALKGGRKIVVRGQAFRWTLSGKGRWGWSPQTPHVAIQADTERPGTPMVAHLTSRRWISYEAHDMDTNGVPHQAAVTPQDIRSLIERALDAGWDPTRRVKYTTPAGIDLSDYTTRDKR